MFNNELASLYDVWHLSDFEADEERKFVCSAKFVLKSFYRNPSRQHGGHLNVIEMGNFTIVHSLQLNEQFKGITTIKHRMNMQGIKLNVTAVITQKLHEPFQNYLQHQHEPHRDPLSRRFTYTLLDIIKEMFNLT